MTDERYERGWETLKGLSGSAGTGVINSLSDIAPDFGRLIVEFSYGEIYNRPGLGLRDRQLVTIAALTALGTATRQLKVHIEGGLNVGLTRDEIVETMIHVAVLAGFPAALNAIFAAEEVFTRLDADARSTAE